MKPERFRMKTSRLLLVLFGLAAVCLGAVAEQKPNVIIILADDQGYQDVGCFGSPLIKTPNLDRMAEEGTRFTSFDGMF